MKYRITHRTTYEYSEDASLSQNELFLQPRESPFQHVLESNLSVDPIPQYRQDRIDYFGNKATVIMVQHHHIELMIEARSTVETIVSASPKPTETLAWEKVAQEVLRHDYQESLFAYQFTFPSPMVQLPAGARVYVKQFFPPGQPVLVGALQLIEAIYKEFEYNKAATTVDTTVEQALTNKKGVCQDFAHVTISCLRSLGLPARYVSGYLETTPPPGKPKLVGADASHAWLAIYIPGFGWVDLDPTNNLIPGEKHITLAWGRDYSDVTPVKGVVMGGGSHRLQVSVDVSHM